MCIRDSIATHRHVVTKAHAVFRAATPQREAACPAGAAQHECALSSVPPQQLTSAGGPWHGNAK
eukprot:4078870-Prorocentrum_lima.AAC.1